jgi:hypothetical protein
MKATHESLQAVLDGTPLSQQHTHCIDTLSIDALCMLSFFFTLADRYLD